MGPFEKIDFGAIQVAFHFENYYPGDWVEENDWSFYGLSNKEASTNRIGVYSNGELVHGEKPSFGNISEPTGNCDFYNPICTFDLNGAEKEEIVIQNKHYPQFIQINSWPGMNNRWWSPEYYIQVTNVGELVLPFSIIINQKKIDFDKSFWYKEVELGSGPWILEVPRNSGKFKLKLENR